MINLGRPLSFFSNQIVTYTMKIPLTKSFRATTLFKAFLINAFVSAIIATIIVEVRYTIESGKGDLYEYIREIFNSGQEYGTNELSKVRSTFLIGFLVTLFLYNALYVLIAYGGGSVAPNKMASYF